VTLPVNLRSVNEEAWLNSQVGPYAVCGIRSVARIGLSPTFAVFGSNPSLSHTHISLIRIGPVGPYVNLKFDSIFKQHTYSQIIPVLYST